MEKGASVVQVGIYISSSPKEYRLDPAQGVTAPQHGVARATQSVRSGFCHREFLARIGSRRCGGCAPLNTGDACDINIGQRVKKV